MSDTAPPNSTFADRAKARGTTKQVTAADARNKAVTTTDDSDEPQARPTPATKARAPRG